MKSSHSQYLSGVIRFPSTRLVQAFTHNEADLALAREHDTDIYELCRETSLALQELRHAIDYLLRDVVEQLDMDESTLAEALDECPRVARDIIDGEFDEITTESMIECLEKLRSRICSV